MPIAILMTIIMVVWFFVLGKEIRVEKACELFRLQKAKFPPLFLAKAAASGKPRGLRWVECLFADEVLFAKESATHSIIALVPVQIQFEAIAGSDMETVEAVPHPRHGSALLRFHNGQWDTEGRVVFNLTPTEVLSQFTNDYTSIGITRSDNIGSA